MEVCLDLFASMTVHSTWRAGALSLRIRDFGTLATLATCVGFASACSSAAEDEAQGAGFSGPVGADDDGGDESPDPSDDDRADGEGDTGGSDGQGAPPPPKGDDGGGGTTGSSAEEAPCPEPLPADWLFCEDFETLVDPSESFFEYADAEGAFALVDHMGASGERSMEVTYREGQDNAGLLLVSFGESPIDQGVRPAYVPEARFDEIWWRFRIRMEPGWPGFGPGRLTRATAFAAEDWSEAFVAHVHSTPDADTLEAVPHTCVTAESNIACSGYDDAAGFESLGGLHGQTPLFSAEAAGTWHCVEVHMRVNTLGQPDGVLEFWVDDVHEAGREDLDWRGTWDAYGINAVAIENFWDGGAPTELRRWIDDLVISTAPIGCE